MTGREQLELHVRRIRRCLALGFGLYFIPILAAYFVPWLALLVPVGVVLCGGALVIALRSMRCPECAAAMGNLLLVKQAGKLFALPPDLVACPHCGCDLDTHRGHDDLLEILSGYERDGAYRGVIGAPVKGATQRYELTLCGEARNAFSAILRLQPFGKHGGAYRYFITPPYPDEAAGKVKRLKVRVEKGAQETAVDISAPASLRSLLAWLCALDNAVQVTGLTLKGA